jgi:uncharacterized protein YdaU (DUF1376 family)
MADSQGYHKAPAYQYYPDNFEQGTAAFTLAEVGAYQRLLNYQWSNGSIPGDSIKALSLILRCTPSVAKSVWNTVSAKFVRDDHGEWRNARMERERSKQLENRDRAASHGKAGAAKRWQKGGHGDPISHPIAGQPWPTDSFPSPTPSSSPIFVVANATTQARQRQHESPRFADRSHMGHVFGFCDFKCLSEQKIREFSQDLPGGATEVNFATALKWAESVRDGWGERPKLEPKWFEFWEARWREHLATVAVEADKAAFVAKMEAKYGR